MLIKIKNKIFNGNALDVLKTFTEKSIDMAITSPPYWGLRDYGIDGQLGLEPTFDLYIKHLCDIFDETKRVLKDEATLWVNIGDTYDKNKSLIGIPFRFAIEMINRGWILRNTLIWHKNSVMPSSVKDRFTLDFEYIFFFSMNKKYYFQQQFEPHTSGDSNTTRLFRAGTKGHDTLMNKEIAHGKRSEKDDEDIIMRYGKHGRNKRTVWNVNTKPFKEAHFAVFPEALIETPILAGCPPKGIVLDMFMGAGTTGVVAKKNNRKYVVIARNQAYIKIAENRILSGL